MVVMEEMVVMEAQEASLNENAQNVVIKCLKRAVLEDQEGMEGMVVLEEMEALEDAHMHQEVH